MNDSILLFGDAEQCLRKIPSETADCCITSPPYYGLRDYGADGQIGLEESPEAYINRLVGVFREVKRVLKPDGTLWIVIGDSYAGSGKGAAEYPENAKKYKQGTNLGMLGQEKTTKVPKRFDGIKSKDLIGIPWLLAFALRADGWYLRQDIVWAKTNPMPESVRDRCTKSHEYIFLLSKSPRYYFDAQAIAEPTAESSKKRSQNFSHARYGGNKYTNNPDVFYRTKSGGLYSWRSKRNKRSVWSVSVHGYRGAHFATYPEALITPCVLAGSKPGGFVLDPFFGSGTTGKVAQDNGRKYIGIELNEEYKDLIKARLSGKDAR